MAVLGWNEFLSVVTAGAVLQKRGVFAIVLLLHTGCDGENITHTLS